MGCALDLDSGKLTFYRNGQSLGVAYDRVRTMQPSLAYFPAVSLSHAERCTLNFGAKPFVYPVQGHQPLHAPPSRADVAAAQYYCSCLGRLVQLAAERQDSNNSSRADGNSSQHDAAGSAATQQQKAADELPHGMSLAASAEAPAAPSAAMAAAAAAGRLGLGFPASCSPRESGSGGWGPRVAGAAPSSADMVLLAAVVMEPLQQLLVWQPYLIHSALLPLMADLQREGEAAGQQRAVQQLLQLALLVWDQQAFSSVMIAVLEDLAYR